MAQAMAVCIARQFGSGGRAVGMALAQKLGAQFYDRELLKVAADKSGILQELFEQHDERPARRVSVPVTQIPTKAPSYADYMAYLPNDNLQNVVAEVIREAADAGPCVIIGRCADYILRGQAGMCSVFVHAELEVRTKRIARAHNLDEDAARALIRKTDRSRANYYSYYTDRDWGAIDNYHFGLDAGRLGIDKSVDVLAYAVQQFCR